MRAREFGVRAGRRGWSPLTGRESRCGKKTQPWTKRCKNATYKRLTGIHLSRTDMLSSAVIVLRSFQPERRQAPIAFTLAHAGLHFISHQGSFLGFIWQSVRFNILNPPGYERGLSKNSQNALETSLNHSTQDPSIAAACDRGVF